MRTTRTTIAIASATGALLFGGAGIANAEHTSAPAPSSTTTLADDAYGNSNNDNTGLWGLAGLLGLIGLVGLKKRNDHDDYRRTGANVGATRGTGTGTGPMNRDTPPPPVV